MSYQYLPSRLDTNWNMELTLHLRARILMNTIRFRILMLLTAFSLAFMAGLACWQVSEAEQLRAVGKQSARDTADFVTRITDLRSASLTTFVEDYTIWDEFCTFVKTKDAKWAKVNLDAALPTYDTDTVWVYDASMKPIYGAAPKYPQLGSCPLSPSQLTAIFARQKSQYFFSYSQICFNELSCYEIYTSADRKRQKPLHGYMLCARLWDREILDSLSSLTAAKASIIHESASAERVTCTPVGDGSVVYIRQFVGPDGKPVRALKVVIDSKIERMLKQTNSTTVNLVAAFTLILLALLFLCLFRWVSAPLKTIMHTLQTKDVVDLSTLASAKGEFAEVARLVHDFFAQQQVLLEEIAERTRAEAELQDARDELEMRVEARTVALAQAYDSTIEGWSKALDLRDQETEGHCQRVTDMTVKLAAAMGMSEAQILEVRRGALLHDIGKMGIPDAILLKPGPLNEEEWRVMRMHPVYAKELLSPIDFLKDALAIPYYHHEKWDGTGYPQGLSGEDIPLEARLFCIVDVWDALRSDRPYRKGWPDEKIFEHIKSLSGTHFEPAIVDLFISIAEREERPMSKAA